MSIQDRRKSVGYRTGRSGLKQCGCCEQSKDRPGQRLFCQKHKWVVGYFDVCRAFKKEKISQADTVKRTKKVG